MLNLSLCGVRVSRNRAVASGVTSLEEGIGLIAVRVAGQVTVKPGVGGANTEEFAGVALNERTAPTLAPLVYRAKVVLVTSGQWGVVLNRNVVGTPRVVYTASGTALTASGGGAPTAGQYRVVNNNVVEVNTADLGKEIEVTYTYAPTIADLYQLGGDNSPTTFATLPTLIGVTGVIEEGLVYTTNFDPSADWAGWTPASTIKVGANGVFQIGGTGASVKGRVMHAPSVDIPFLGIDFSVL
jgi:hypothetical protein